MHRFLTALLLAGMTTLIRAAEPGVPLQPSPAELAFFETRIRPVLVEHCYPCHSAEAEKPKAGLRLDSRAAVLRGGDSGPAAIAGEPENSLLIKAVRYADQDLQMPPKKGKLPDQTINDLIAWIQRGLPWPVETQTSEPKTKRAFAITAQDRTFWAFQPIAHPALPRVHAQSWAANGIDAFVLAELERKGIAPNPPATPRELIRRLFFDLLGVPPTPAEMEAFEKDSSPAAYEQWVDRLLARPEYGERWARHWLDPARFAQSNGYERDGEKPFAWRYRDYVIKAFNQDKPFDRFIQEQIAGDELPDATADSVAATAFQRLGVWDDEPDDPTMAEYDGLDDIVSTTSTMFLGLTLGCARCHDHKFDPISQADYYQFLAFFRDVRPNENARYTLDSANYLPLAAPTAVREWQWKRAGKIQSLESSVACASEGPEKVRLIGELEKAQAETWPGDWTLAVREQEGKPLPTRILIRGNPNMPGPEVEPGFLTVLGGEKPIIRSCEGNTRSSGRRLALARWIASAENPLTARVAVNRVWHHHFGQGIVKTTGDFGRSGLPPTHPRLLDWLASEFIQSHWSLKRLHRLILLSNTYRMSSRSDNAQALAIDPGNDLLWRQRLRRLEAESLWDTMLSVSGELNPAMGGRGFFPHLNGEVLAGESRPGMDWELSSRADQSRRSIYIYVRRTMLAPLLETFDYNNTSSPLAERPTTTVAPQALMLLNSEWAQERARAFATRLAKESGDDQAKRIQTAYELALGRVPTPGEVSRATRFLERQGQGFNAIGARLTFSPELPNSLFADYLKQLKPTDYLRGPAAGWSYHLGRWSKPYEGIRTMNRARGPFALWRGQKFEDGIVEAEILLQRASESGSVLLRSDVRDEEQHGYEVAFDPRHQTVRLVRHGSDLVVLGEGKAPVPSGRPCPIRIRLDGSRIRVWLRPNADTPPLSSASARSAPPAPPYSNADLVLDLTDPDPVRGPGWLGVRSAGAAFSLDHLRVQTGTGTVQICDACSSSSGQVRGESVDETQIDQRAWRNFCLLLMNLNEFIYVD